MKRIFFWLVMVALCFAPAGRAQDAATQERLDKLTGRIDDLEKSQEALRKQMSELSRELGNLRDQMNKPNSSYAGREDLKTLADDIKKVDQKRIDDAEKVQSELLKLRKLLEGSLTSPKQRSGSQPREKTVTEKPAGDEKVFPYVIQSGDTLDAIVQAYKDKNIKITVAQILKANPGLKAERLRVGQKIFIPAPQQ